MRSSRFADAKNKTDLVWFHAPFYSIMRSYTVFAKLEVSC